WRITEIACS
ncbi:hypothetical protein D039_4408B, partial [Vibrio parahaemolyticus EKP-028]